MLPVLLESLLELLRFAKYSPLKHLFYTGTVRMTPDQMKSRLEKAYPDGAIVVVDLTGTEDHWQVVITSKAFKGLSRIQQHKHVMDVFAPELKTGEVHALTIQTKLPENS